MENRNLITQRAHWRTRPLSLPGSGQSHEEIWAAIDQLAARQGLTSSALAKMAGLDATTFNKSKRVGAEGDKPRWPSTESIAKALQVLRMSWSEFGALVEKRSGPTIPLLGFAQAGTDGFFDDAGLPSGEGWDAIRFPGIGDDDVYALEVMGESMLPVYRPGDLVVVSPSATLRRGDRVVVRLQNGEVLAKELGRLTEKIAELRSFNPDFPLRIVPRAEISWMARILWSSQ